MKHYDSNRMIRKELDDQGEVYLIINHFVPRIHIEKKTRDIYERVYGEPILGVKVSRMGERAKWMDMKQFRHFLAIHVTHGYFAIQVNSVRFIE